ncbi:MAG: DUF368 domain-containing protein [Flavobacteriaceae bacterium]|nr:DUF368 domain-containing protein [Flavobacteriaceae bacterium]
MKRNFLDYLLLTLKGMLMGAADIVPGISGGTIALITGIYEELIYSLSNFNLSIFKDLQSQGLKKLWERINGNFLLSIFSGILISILLFSKLISVLLKKEPILIWSFFFGLVVASVLYVFKKIERLNTVALIVLLVGVFIAYQITKLEILISSESYLYLFFSGAIAICAMILPGISGAFILVIMGTYSTVLQSINDKDFLKIATFGFGALIGILYFSKILKWLFVKYKDLTLALLIGFMTGALVKIWPWKKVLTERINSKGIPVPLREECVLPYEYEGDPQLFDALNLMLIGFLLIFIFNFISSKTKSLESP